MSKENETKLCKYCQTEIPKKAKVCPNCKKKQGGILKWVIIGVIALAIIGSIVGGNDSNKDNSKNANETTKSNSMDNTTGGKENNAIESTESEEEQTEEYIEITSTDLIDIYNENQVKCKQLYDGKLLKVTGTVESVGTDILDNVYVCLGHDIEYVFVGIQCYAKDKDTENKIAELKEGDTITVIGKGSCGSMAFSLEKSEIVD